MTVRRLPLAVGLVAVAAGGAIALGIGPAVPTLVRSLLLVAVVVAGTLVAARAALTRAAEGPRSDPLPAPDRTDGVRVPGEEVDRDLGRIASDDATHAALEERLETVAVATIARTDGCSPAAARERLAAGTWTDDERAAAFFTGSSPTPSVRERLQALVTGETVARRQAVRVVDELHERRREG